MTGYRSCSVVHVRKVADAQFKTNSQKPIKPAIHLSRSMDRNVQNKESVDP
jgi:hypothetical protein